MYIKTRWSYRKSTPKIKKFNIYKIYDRGKIIIVTSDVVLLIKCEIGYRAIEVAIVQ